jgi:mono/diheme cytochrome c family protein
MKKNLLISLLLIVLAGCSESESVVKSETNDEKLISVASVDLSPKPGTDRWFTEAQLKEGQEIYAQFCATCHGKKAESVETWRKLDSNGNYPPPPLNGSAHAWHHPLRIMDRVISEGGAPLGGVMPAWKDVLTEDQRLKAVASFQAYWDEETYDRWLEREHSDRGR